MNPTADPINPAPCPKCGGSGTLYAPPPGPGDYITSWPCDCRPAAWKCPRCGGERDYCRCNDDCRPAAPVEPKCTCWIGTDSTFGSSAERKLCAVHGEQAPSADRGRSETDLAGQRAEVLLCKWADARDRLDELKGPIARQEWRDEVHDEMRKIETHMDSVLAERDAATAEVGRLRAKLRVMHYWARCEPEKCNLDGGQEHAEYFAIGGAEWDQKTTR